MGLLGSALKTSLPRDLLSIVPPRTEFPSKCSLGTIKWRNNETNSRRSLRLAIKASRALFGLLFVSSHFRGFYDCSLRQSISKESVARTMKKEKKRSETICSDSRVLLNRGESRVRVGCRGSITWYYLGGKVILDIRGKLCSCLAMAPTLHLMVSMVV